MKKIPLTQGQFALVDDKDFEDLSKFKWYAWWNPYTRSFYAVREIRSSEKRTSEYMHRRILGLYYGDRRKIDHKNHDTTDNRRCNIRIATTRENAENQINQSKYGAGVAFHRNAKSKPFEARTWLRGKYYSIGTFSTPEQAQKARRKFIESLK